ncbi:MAG: sigma-70 family RNA polymerase sigma factor [Planctomycetes bacterium]|nr:sigma-70 family RNA polymerase sigma factor [Planctomycetota bacterium]
MADTPESRILVDQWRAGNEKAAQELFDRYAERLLALARRRISQRLASRVDPEDVVQSVFRTFFARAREGQFQLQQQDDLAKLLFRITVHKTLRQVEFHKAAKRNPNLETAQGSQSQDTLRDLLAREPTPEDAVAFLDQLEHFLSQLRPDERAILEMRMQGCSNTEIAEKLGVYDRKIRRVLERVRGLAEQEHLTPG